MPARATAAANITPAKPAVHGGRHGKNFQSSRRTLRTVSGMAQAGGDQVGGAVRRAVVQECDNAAGLAVDAHGC